MSIAVVGAAHRNADGSDRALEIDQCIAGEPVALVPEPENKFDPYAIAVFSSRGIQIGYVSAERARRLTILMGQAEVQAVFQRAFHFGAWIRIAFDGEVPTLTDAMLHAADEPADQAARDEPDFYPDEIWPDD